MRVCVLALLVLLLATANPRAEAPWSTLSSAVGVYQGWASSGGSLVPVETRIAADTDGVLSGTYRYDQDGQVFHGTLGHGRAAGPTDLVFIWHDDWGYGVLTLHFEPGFERFTGAWGTLDDGAVVFPWVGIRTGTEN